jgi:hypothetical protein
VGGKVATGIARVGLAHLHIEIGTGTDAYRVAETRQVFVVEKLFACIVYFFSIYGIVHLIIFESIHVESCGDVSVCLFVFLLPHLFCLLGTLLVAGIYVRLSIYLSGHENNFLLCLCLVMSPLFAV